MRYTCKQCRDKGEEWTQIRDWIARFCSKSCRLEFQRVKVRKEKEKVKVRKVKAKTKKANSITSLTKRADKLWSEVVKIEYNYQCQVEWCEKTEYLNSHHIFTRSRKSTRWDIDNWICVCAWHHTLNSDFSMHKTPYDASIWLDGIKGRDWMHKLMRKSQQICKVTPELLNDHIKSLQDYIKST